MSDTLFDVLTSQLRDDEGLELKPYTDTTGNLTIGYGRNLSAKGLSKTECEFLLANDARESIELAKNNLPWFDSLSIPRQAVITNMIFNLGLDGVMKFKNMLNSIQVGNFRQASIEMLDSEWANQVGHRAKYLSQLMTQG